MKGRILFSKKLVFINSVSSIVTRVISIVVLVWAQQYLLKRIAVEEYSLLPVIYSMIVFLPFFTLILTSGVKRYVLDAYSKNDDERITQIVSTMFPIFCLGGLLLFTVVGVLALHIDTIIQVEPKYIDDARLMLILVISLEAFRVPMEAFSSGLYVKQRFVLQNLIKIISEVLRLAILLTLLLGVSVSVISVVVATVVSGIVEIITLFIVSRRLLPSQKYVQSEFDWSIVKELTKFGGWSSLYGFSGMVRKAADPIILNQFSTSLDVTCFHLGSLVPNRLEVMVNQSFVGAISPVVVGLNADQQYEKLKRVYLRLGRFSLWGVLLVVAPFWVNYELIVELYVGDTYFSAGMVLFLLIACYPFVYGNILHTSLANAKLRMRSLAIRETASAMVNLLLTLLLVGYYQLGAIGSATATFIVYGLGSLLFFWPFGKGMVGATWKEVWDEIIFPGVLPLFTAVLAMMAIVALFPVETWIGLAVNFMSGSMIYLTVMWFVAKDVDRSQFIGILQKINSQKVKNSY